MADDRGGATAGCWFGHRVRRRNVRRGARATRLGGGTATLRRRQSAAARATSPPDQHPDRDERPKGYPQRRRRALIGTPPSRNRSRRSCSDSSHACAVARVHSGSAFSFCAPVRFATRAQRDEQHCRLCNIVRRGQGGPQSRKSPPLSTLCTGGCPGSPGESVGAVRYWSGQQCYVRARGAELGRGWRRGAGLEHVRAAGLAARDRHRGADLGALAPPAPEPDLAGHPGGDGGQRSESGGDWQPHDAPWHSLPSVAACTALRHDANRSNRAYRTSDIDAARRKFVSRSRGGPPALSSA